MVGMISGEFVRLIYVTMNEFDFPDPLLKIEKIEEISPRNWYDWEQFCSQLDQIHQKLTDIQIRDIGARIIQKTIFFYQNLGYDNPFTLVEDFEKIIPTKGVPLRNLPHNFITAQNQISFEIESGLPVQMIEGMVIRIFKSFNYKTISGKTSQLSEHEEIFRILIKFQVKPNLLNHGPDII
jgi:hypothetical protein